MTAAARCGPRRRGDQLGASCRALIAAVTLVVGSVPPFWVFAVQATTDVPEAPLSCSGIAASVGLVALPTTCTARVGVLLPTVRVQLTCTRPAPVTATFGLASTW